MINSKYAIIASSVFDTDEVAQSISLEPRRFVVENTEYVILSLNLEQLDSLIAYVLSIGAGVEYEFIKGSGNVSIITHEQALALLQEQNNE
jgi:hypothetical protein